MEKIYKAVVYHNISGRIGDNFNEIRKKKIVRLSQCHWPNAFVYWSDRVTKFYGKQEICNAFLTSFVIK